MFKQRRYIENKISLQLVVENFGPLFFNVLSFIFLGIFSVYDLHLSDLYVLLHVK